jgi:hypothetical protein
MQRNDERTVAGGVVQVTSFMKQAPPEMEALVVLRGVLLLASPTKRKRQCR